MRVEIHVPDKVWVAALNLAETNHTTVAAVIEGAIRDAIRPSAIDKLRAQARQNQIVQAWGEGLTDAQIAERTGELKAYVGDVRRRAKLPPNMLRDRRTTTERKTA